MGKVAKREEQEWIKRECQVIGAPFADGQPIKGVELAPMALRQVGMVDMIEKCGWNVKDMGDLSVEKEEEDGCTIVQAGNVRNAYSVGRTCSEIAAATCAAATQKNFVLTIGGDHGIAAGSISGLLGAHPDLAVIWVDAHADCNTPETSPSGNYHGMPLAHIMGWFPNQIPGFEWMDKYPKVNEDRVALIALRDVDDCEKELLAKSKVSVFTMSSIDRKGIATIISDALSKVDPEGVRPLHLSFDIDSCDPSIACGTGTTARGGLTFREAHYIAETLHETGRLVSMDLVEVNPSLDVQEEVQHGDRVKSAATKTVRLAAELIGSAMGNVIM